VMISSEDHGRLHPGRWLRTATGLKILWLFTDKSSKGEKMKIFEPVPVRVVSSRAIRRPLRGQSKIACKRTLLRRFERFIESTRWDERVLCSKWIDRACIAVLSISVLYFLPTFVPLFLR
jgi:hypothetical protein